MELLFLGQKYHRDLPQGVSCAQGNVTGSYRGAPWRETRCTVPAEAKRKVTLHFRGQTYQSEI